MRTYQHEDELRSLGVNPKRPQTLVALPLAAVLAADGKPSPNDIDAALATCRDVLGLDENEVEIVRHWLESPLAPSDMELGTSILVDLRAASDVLAIENNVLTRALGEAEAILSRRSEAAPSAKGRQVISNMEARLQLDPGTPWKEMAPEQFEKKPPSSSKGKPIRRHLTNRRLDRDDLERGGIV